MRNKHLAAASTLLSAATLASAQGQAQWLWTVETDDADAIVEPGESATITLSMLMTPDIEENFAYLGGVYFDTLGQSNAAKGFIRSWEVVNDLSKQTGDTTTTDGVSLFDTSASQVYLSDPFDTSNPVDILQFVWTTDDFASYTVSYQTSSASLKNDVHIDGMIDVYTGRGFPDLFLELWPVEEATITFQVVPAPSAFAILGLLATFRRRPLRPDLRGDLSR